MGHYRQPGQANQNTPQRGQTHGPVHQVQEREQHSRDHLGLEKHLARQVNPNEQHGAPHHPKAAPHTGVAVFIDHKPYHSDKAEFTGADLRKLAVPPLGPERQIFRVVAGNGGDVKIEDSDVITVNFHDAHEGRHFFSKAIVPVKDAEPAQNVSSTGRKTAGRATTLKASRKSKRNSPRKPKSKAALRHPRQRNKTKRK